ncbi:MAG TPA: phosphodiester glycosidase family protein [Chryseolinea sp.]|nr:phosphodiester glycosidase family protein [Chryseolinea sp.]
MKKWYFILSGLLLPALTINYAVRQIGPMIQGIYITPTPESTVEEIPPDTIEIKKGGNIYRVSWFIVDDLNLLSLLPNFDNKLPSKTFKEQNDCDYLTNGGFYTKEDTPLGLFVSEGETFTAVIPHALFNGFFYATLDHEVGISRVLPKKEFRFAVQTGPMLIENNRENVIRLRGDKTARRMVAGLTEMNQIVFLAIYNGESLLQGPYLSDLPAILTQLNEKASFTLLHAVNLDGGFASSFISEFVMLPEVNYSGSFFCAKGPSVKYDSNPEASPTGVLIQ